ncbi:SDR family NAD(P)-dependent oxidoreductase [Mycobacterium shimoidei]|uniref:3-oxoacyl-[acyl-carrier-protein] reductase MabA n=1 Tax=Mycobacterium shimoidei TaxID=29313 RepID=A0A1E3TIW0_MYCSH|nr:SDR family oxidoreductase [Mycobacterium shimoidei]MCV7261011.1 SDR family oxidoreductase [Mycobacterium shimoidei]ODR13602.1 short-chain dehydrogenase [Mycobacterium shimoidei]ORW76485.1 short-chain dehydrogenase [Mycobacterium shimoidei]SRX93609.1 short-chain dehydrogenase/reductase SDR [Actinoplanes friuliensis DSM 7358] [Mycobacterium shimoidei]
MAPSLAGSAALVTGATAGIGREVALQLAGLGAEVVVHGRNPERGAEVVQEIQNGGGTARFVAADLSDADDVRRLAAEAGPVDILINNAGVYKFGATADTDDAFFDEHVNINLRAPYILVQQLVPGMAERGSGVVVNLSTVAAAVPARMGGIYGATKAGVELLTRAWADEFGRSGVRVNAVQAGPTETPGTAVTPGLTDGLGALTALGRAAQADEIANVIAFLASPAAGYVNGAIVQANGGQVAIAP